MARHASNYRQARREAWRALNKEGLNGFVPWANFNSKAGYGIGTRPATRGDVILRNKFGAVIDRFPRQPVQGRSRYMPHIGAKQRAKGAAA
jgi:hypothetical protein